ncbi:unnamed protein product [Bursaphelenchus okinawaensis]|uniref:Uncharacterized protein n=1 Tax=Bursaphelenchus okinawaensis TaxID=465554 RepID=A0A811JUG6_9BILA|nr:unnamed protein product [Bursaphelenchus okinawaensis]CAG9083492.1 unnamed protein product [Bursaphelenchus okinawaensis]
MSRKLWTIFSFLIATSLAENSYLKADNCTHDTRDDVVRRARPKYCISNDPTVGEVEIIPDTVTEDNKWTKCMESCYALHETEHDNWMFGCSTEYDFLKRLCRSIIRNQMERCFYVPEITNVYTKYTSICCCDPSDSQDEEESCEFKLNQFVDNNQRLPEQFKEDL